MYEILIDMAYDLNETAMLFRSDGKISHEVFIRLMNLVSKTLDDAEKEKEKEKE